MYLVRDRGYDIVVLHDQGKNSLAMVEERLSQTCEKILADHRTIVSAVRADSGTPYL